ncbi:hypothetical protein M752DRAFT_275075 [Aspergillus phoenicis ATCC 13157]|uniref:Uncharacterized protein n=1 Tax=Aspergillus phoenicis ATCC 13157 TaxID=1353007 RepID=A0A370PNL9_ASPPH|nr:hypothetical protein M752DRAFT_275075 [Aspergillus phoenicis ATCC 13157]
MGLESQMSIGVGGSDDYQLNLALRPATIDLLVRLFCAVVACLGQSKSAKTT